MEADRNNIESLENQFVLSEDSQKESRVSVEILNQELLLRSLDLDLDGEYLKTIAKYIDDTACAIQTSNPHLSDKNILILTALNISDMLHKKQIELEKKQFEIEQKDIELSNKHDELEQKLSEIKQKEDEIVEKQLEIEEKDYRTYEKENQVIEYTTYLHTRMTSIIDILESKTK